MCQAPILPLLVTIFFSIAPIWRFVLEKICLQKIPFTVGIPRLHLGVLELAFERLDFSNLASSLHKVLLKDILTLIANGKHASLCTDISKIGTVEVVAELDDGFKV